MILCLFLNSFCKYLLSLFCAFPSDGETFISADDLRINLWNLEISSQSFNIVDVKPTNMEDLTGKLLCVIRCRVLLFNLLAFYTTNLKNFGG